MLVKTRIAGLITALMVLSVPMVYADGSTAPTPAHRQGDWHQGQHDQMIAKVLNLSADQEKQLKDIRQTEEKAMKNTFEQMKSNKEAFNAEIVKATPDMNKINDIQAKTKVIQSQMTDERLNSILAIKKLMTPEQFAGYMALENAKKVMMHNGRHGFGKNGWEHKDWGNKKDEGRQAGPQD